MGVSKTAPMFESAISDSVDAKVARLMVLKKEGYDINQLRSPPNPAAGAPMMPMPMQPPPQSGSQKDSQSPSQSGSQKSPQKESSQDRRQEEHPGSMASKLEGELYLREMTTQFKTAGVYDVVEGRPDPAGAEQERGEPPRA